MAARIFGEISGVPVGQILPSREAASKAGVHRPTQGGISGAEGEGADSIVVSGGYEDDVDLDDEIIYTGHGGNDPATGKQIGHQELTRGNRALARSADEGLPVRVIRGSGGDPKLAPRSGYRYDGLYYVDRYWSEIGKSGYRVWRYRLIRESETQAGESGGEPMPGAGRRVLTQVQRIVRTTEVAQRVKALHGHRCQICGEVVQTAAGLYAEAAHIRPLGRPHDGPDHASNILCLCPNDHVRFDRGAVVVNNDLNVVNATTGEVLRGLRTVAAHHVASEQLQYHRERFVRR